ncbi:MAG: tRNA lysidine(34) synthetase TilS [Alphaproteobacteria bacterium]|nr:tRNA lysidine(34) synthetase TilS [Alphaproteobacteria bacterium]
MSDQDSAIGALEARGLFADLRGAPAIVLAVSGGPDSVALLWLVARWRRALVRGPELVAVTVDHGLRAEAAAEARAVKELARQLGVVHHTRRWSGDKPKTGIPAAAREARYRLLMAHARRQGASHVLTAHTSDDQAETFLMRLLRGSGIRGLGAMARITDCDGILLTRPLLDVPKARLIATLERAGVGFAVDPTNHDPAYTRARLRALWPMLCEEGLSSASLARLAARLGRADAALEVLADGAERFLALIDDQEASPRRGFDGGAFAALPEEIRLRLLMRAINAQGHEGPAELGKVEALLTVLDAAREQSGEVKRSLAGAVIQLHRGRLSVAPAPRRRQKGTKA